MTLETPAQPTWKAAALAAGIRPGAPVTDDQWLDAWTGYGKARIARFKSFVGRLADVLSELRGALGKLTDRMAHRKARLEEINRLAAIGIDHDVTPLRQYASRARRIEKAALAVDEETLARLMVGLQDLGIGLEETHPHD